MERFANFETLSRQLNSSCEAKMRFNNGKRYLAWRRGVQGSGTWKGPQGLVEEITVVASKDSVQRTKIKVGIQCFGRRFRLTHTPESSHDTRITIKPISLRKQVGKYNVLPFPKLPVHKEKARKVSSTVSFLEHLRKKLQLDCL